MAQQGRITAVLGPTNTGKTHLAIERMLAHRTGVIGLPLRLLAREVYDKIVAARGPSVVALVTGEERILPPRAQYWVCTVEAMPQGMGCDFLAVDEIQLCADPERGHVFTDRLLRARGLHETMFLGSDSMRGVIADLIPSAQFIRRERMSTLSYSGSRKISRMQPRSAIVSFSVDNLYAIAELMKRQKGGAAVVIQWLVASGHCGQWRVASGEWPVASCGQWRVASGEWPVASQVSTKNSPDLSSSHYQMM